MPASLRESSALMSGREPKTSRNWASRARRCGCWSVRIDRLPCATVNAAVARSASSEAAARAEGRSSGVASSSASADRGELLVERAGSHQTTTSIDDAEREGPVQLQAGGVARQDVGVRLRAHHALRGHDVIVEPQRDGAARVRADQAEVLHVKRRALVRVDQHRHDAIAVARRHQDDVDPSPSADPRSLAVEDHVAVRGVRRAQDRRAGPVPRQRDARATLTATQGASHASRRPGVSLAATARTGFRCCSQTNAVVRHPEASASTTAVVVVGSRFDPPASTGPAMP